MGVIAGHKKDEHLQRAFWSRVSLNPPLYGADTDVSFFDKDLDFGWNMHNLGDLLQKNNIPAIPGVTTPMTYFGMWKVQTSYLLASPQRGLRKSNEGFQV